MPAKIETLRERKDQLFSIQSTARDVWQELGDYLCPHRANITIEREPGTKQTDNIFDSSGPHYVDLLTATLSGTLTSPSQKWFGLVSREEEFNAMKPVQDFLEEVADRSYLAINQSNFNAEMSEVFLDLVVFGTGCLFIEERDPEQVNVFAGLRYQAIPVGDFAIAEGPDGRVNTLYRRLRMSVAALLAKFGDEALGPELTELADKRPDDLIECYHAVYPREEGASGRQKGRMPFASCYFVTRPMKIIAEGGFHEFPFAVPRWRKVAGEVYGRGPAHTALPDVRSLNEAVKLYLQAATLAIRPPLNVLEDSISSGRILAIEPAYLNMVRDKDAITPMELGSRFDVAQMLNERLETKIADLFFIRQLHLKDSPQMTATEVVQRQEETQRLLGPTAGRLHSELLSVTVERTIAIMGRANVLPPVPQELAQTDVDIDIVYEGPLARAQKTLDLVAIERKNAWMLSVYPMKPDVLDITDWDAEGKHVAQVAGVPGDLMLGTEQIQAIRAQRAQLQAAQAKMQMMAGVADAAGKAAPALKLMQGGQPEPAA
jgi:hypothetical protein